MAGCFGNPEACPQRDSCCPEAWPVPAAPRNRSSAYCDAIGCHIPQRVNTISFSLMQLGWGANVAAVSTLGLAKKSLGRRMHSRQWRCREGGSQLLVDAELLQSPETLAAYVQPLQRLRYADWVGNSSAASSRSSAEPFSVDHQVFGTYGGFWTFVALSSSSKWKASDGVTPPCHAHSACGVCLHLARLLAEVDIWKSESPRRRLKELEQVLQQLRRLADPVPWHACFRWALTALAQAWHRDAEVGDDVIGDAACLDALPREAAADMAIKGRWPDPIPLECANVEASARLFSVLLLRAAGPTAGETSEERHGLRWRLCGPPGSVLRLQLGPRGLLHGTVLGLWAEESNVQTSTKTTGWKVEIALFVAPSDECVLVDGNRLFQTHPQSYLTPWTCTATAGAFRATSSSQGVVSYSGNIALILCRFEGVPPEEDTVEISLASSVSNLADAGWHMAGISACPWRPLMRPTRQAFPIWNTVTSPYVRGLTVCSEVLYNLTGPYKSVLVQHWLEYHRMIGVDHFVLYDRDGSLQQSRVLEAYILSGFVTYFPRFSGWALSRHHDEIHAGPGLPSHAAPDAQAASHCLFSQRGLSEWVAFLHSPDEYLSSGKGLKDVRQELLSPLRPLRDQGLAALDVTAIYFSRANQSGPPKGPMRSSPWLFGRYVWRASVPIQLSSWGSQVAGFLNRFGSPMVVPERAGDLVAAHFARPSAGTMYLDDVPMDFVRANHYGEAFHARKVIEPGDRPVKDESILWAEEEMAKLALPALPPGPEPKEGNA
eukprot:TRINITY_DN26408_c0_g1_i1.p1 TRINITY_DN26408_c0_g1~~TRINITY_DN26408_c0_g1_i1.p1  ORF type:complete len:773 (+),score=124.46 TRINITY_DN26408_c0_g1_i1:49-2367(+)